MMVLIVELIFYKTTRILFLKKCRQILTFFFIKSQKRKNVKKGRIYSKDWTIHRYINKTFFFFKKRSVEQREYFKEVRLKVFYDLYPMFWENLREVFVVREVIRIKCLTISFILKPVFNGHHCSNVRSISTILCAEKLTRGVVVKVREKKPSK